MKAFWKRGAASQGTGAASPTGAGFRWQRWARKVHLYLGLVMWPFVLLFALSALSFNHPATTRGLTQFRIPAAEVEAVTGFQPPDAKAAAEALVSELSRSKTAGYELEGSPSFSGWALFAAPVIGGKQTLILSLDAGWIDVTERPTPPEEEFAPFDGWRSTVSLLDLQRLTPAFAQLLQNRSIPILGPVQAHPEVHPELRFTVRDDQGALWESKFDLLTRELRATRAVAAPTSLADALEGVHKQHHYAAQRDATWFWALFADFTALTLLLWAVTGIAMWWQQRRLRRIGTWLVALAFLGFALLVTSVMTQQSFGPSIESE